MSRWVIQCMEPDGPYHGAYVARQSERSSYTRSLDKARVFDTAEAALAERCPENEVVVALDDLLPVIRG